MLVDLSSRAAVVPGGVNVGVLRGGDDGKRIVLVDTGLTETAGKKVIRTVREETGGEIVAILTTHAHADHFSANAAVVKRTGARVYAPRFEEATLRYPLLQPALLFGGADPIDTVRGNFLFAHPSPIDEVVAPGTMLIEGLRIEVVPFPGHSPGQVGYLVDGVLYAADVVLPASVLEKYRIPYLFAVGDHLDSLDRAAAIDCAVVVPGHGPTLTRAEFVELVALNRRLVEAVAEAVIDLVREPATAETVLAGLLQRFGAQIVDAPSFYLLQPTAAAFLSYLHRQGRVRHEVRDGRAWWVAMEPAPATTATPDRP